MFGFDQLLDRRGRQHFVRLGDDLTGVGVDDVVREHLAVHVFTRHAQALHLRVFELAHVARRDAAAFLDDDLIADADLERGGLTAQARGDELERHLVLA